MNAGDKKWILIEGTSDENIVGLQLGVSVDLGKLRVKNIRNRGFNEEVDFFDFNRIDVLKGKLKLSWLDKIVQERNFQNTPWIELQVEAIEDICNFDDAITLRNDVMENMFINFDEQYISGEIKLSTIYNGNNNFGENNEAFPNITAYPNPVNNQLQLSIESSVETEGHLEIRDGIGQTINFEISLLEGENTFTFDVSNLKSGILFYNFLSEIQQYSGKVIKMNNQ
ncbi:MAG: T9SS type A sorting domain-containing protein [Bacteroidota bacterium]